uniref:Disco interacting protein 2 homolog C n=1 Tax=Nothobranchius furzeri TaxID=105023 RepID=A0A8C6PMB3_NOTFU
CFSIRTKPRLSLYLFTGDITQRGYEKKRFKLIRALVGGNLMTKAKQSPHAGFPLVLVPSLCLCLADVHTEAVQAVLARHVERKMAVPMPSKRRSLVVQTSMDAYTPPGDETDKHQELSSTHLSDMSHRWLLAVSPSPSVSSSLSPSENHSAPPDVTGYSSDSSHSHTERHHMSNMGTIARNTQKYGNAESDSGLCLPLRSCSSAGVPVSSRVSAKIQQLVNTLKQPRRPPLREFFVDDFDELLEVQQPDPNQPRPEGAEMMPVRGEALGVVTNWPPSLEAALQRWGTISPKAPCLTSLDTAGKPLYVLTYGKLWSRSMKLAYNILHKLGSKQEPMVRPGDRVALVFPNNDPVAFMVAFYGCLLAEVVPVPIEVPLSRKDAGSQQIGFLLGSCGVTVALTSDACHKGLPKSATGEIPQFKGWPKLLWFVTESKHLSKPPRDWFPHIKDANNDTAYIEYKTCKDGSVLGVTVTRIALLTHCQALTQSCSYTEAETIVDVLDFKKDVGLWHGILTSVMNMMHVISVPYSLMKVNPLSWIQKVCQYKAKVACVKSRDMHWALVAHKDQKDINLSSLRMLLVADGSNPWSISSCDAFLNVFQTKGLRAEVICPCASSPEALTVAIRRPVEDSSQPPGRGVLSMQGLSYGVVRVDTEERLSVLTVQDVGTVTPGGLVCVVKPEGVPQLCQTDEIGELCVCSVSTGMSYYGLTGMTKNTFEVYPVSSSGGLISEYAFIRTGLLGFIGPGGLAFITGKMDGLIMVSGRRHNADDIVATALAVEPMKFVYRGSGDDDGDDGDDGGYDDDDDGGDDDDDGGDDDDGDDGDDGGYDDDDDGGDDDDNGDVGDDDMMMMMVMMMVMMFLFLSEILQWRAQTTPDHVLYTLLSSRGAVSNSLTCLQLHKRAERVAALLMERGGLQEGDHVALVYPPGIDLIAAFYGCLYAGCVPITVRPPHPQNISTTLPTVKMIVEVSHSSCVMTTAVICKLLRSKEAMATVDIRNWPPVLDTDDLPKKKPPALYKPTNPDGLAYLDFSVSTTGMLAGVQMSHNAVGAFCRSVKLQCELYPSREVAICLDPYCGLGFVLWCLCSVYSGHQSILIPPVELESNPALWLLAVSQLRVRDTFCSYSVMELCTKGLGLQTEALKARGLDLSRVRACVVVAEERPRMALTHSFSKLFKDLGLHPRSVSTAFGCRVNLAICLQGTSGPDPTTVYVDMRALRHDRVRLVERGSPHSLPLMESGKILPGVRIIIANPETKGPLGDSHLGEIWVHSAHNGSGYYSGYGEEVLQSDHFNSRLSFGDTQTVWARTGYLGFLRRTELTDANGERHDALFVVGALEEAMELRGMRYHPIDIETSVIRAHKSIMECAVFTWTNLLVVVVELEGSEQEALDLVPMVTKAVLEEHYLIVGVVVVTDIGVIPINSRGEKQRMHLRDGFLQDQLDPIYVAYNM